ncbi:FDXHR family putative zinc-binding protein [Saccharopolyspora antimicrobica]|uniref:FDXHR family putative zinc-binding protein n=1 Tax=Saccharopolyspora antimicrobica TaxID=455193 RepID=UPI003F6DEFCC
MEITCGGCSSRWTGVSRCHCSGCHQTFSGVTAFDKHRNRSKCREPSKLGLVIVNGIWTHRES